MGAQIGAYLDGVVVVVEHIRPRGGGALEQRGAVVEAVELVATLWGELDVHQAARNTREGGREREREGGERVDTQERGDEKEREGGERVDTQERGDERERERGERERGG